MNFGQAISSGFANYVTFSGRACRSEYWYWVLFTVLVNIGATIIDMSIFRIGVVDALISDLGPVEALWTLVTLLPSIAVAVRRLHDVDRTGWWVLIAFTIVGILLLLYWAVVKGSTGPNRFGADPLGN